MDHTLRWRSTLVVIKEGLQRWSAFLQTPSLSKDSCGLYGGNQINFISQTNEASILLPPPHKLFNQSIYAELIHFTHTPKILVFFSYLQIVLIGKMAIQ